MCVYQSLFSTGGKPKQEPENQAAARVLIQSFSSRSGPKCKLLCRLKDKGKRYSTLESMLSKKKVRREFKRIFMCF